MTLRRILAVAGASLLLAAGSANAALTTFQTFTGIVGVFEGRFWVDDSVGHHLRLRSVGCHGPGGLSVHRLEHVQWTSMTGINGTTLNGNAVAFGPVGDQSDGCCGIASARANVTGIIKPLIDGGPGGTYDFTD